MTLVLLLGGARSGKSRLAVTLAERHGAAVTFLATGEGLDDEMRDRIAAHRAERPVGWETIEEPVALAGAIEGVDPMRTLIIDCLSLWVANLLDRGEDAVEDRAAAAAGLAAARDGLTVAVTNEVGLGVVPATPLGRAYRDVLGAVNRTWAEASARSALVVAGRALLLEPADLFAPGTAT